MATIIDKSLIRDSIGYFTELRKSIPLRTPKMFEKGSVEEEDYMMHLALTNIAARHLGEFSISDLEVI